MKNQKGVTMIMLIAIISILTILAGITITSSIRSYREIKFDTFSSIMDAVQAKADEIGSDYKAKGYTNYIMYFEDVYGSAPNLLENVSSKKINYIKKKYEDELLVEHSDYIFYFSPEDTAKYLELSGIGEDSFIIDFSTRYVYSVNGCNDPDGDNLVYHTATEYKNGLITDNGGIIETDEKDIKSSLSGISVSSQHSKVGNTDIYAINLKASFSTEGTKYPIKKVFYSKGADSENWVEVEDYTTDEKTNNNSVNVAFSLHESGSYKFKVEDTSGASKEASYNVY